MARRRLKWQQVKQDILELISRTPSDVPLPSRTKMVEMFNTARTTVDKAVDELTKEGILYSMRGSGTYVAEQYASRKAGAPSWAVVLPNILSDTYPGILRGVEDVASRNAINVIICNTENSTAKESTYIRNLINSDVKGVIIIPAMNGDSDFTAFSHLQQHRIPLVFCNRFLSNVSAPFVGSNSFYGGLIATGHLISQGYRNIAYVSLPVYSTSFDRYQGYEAAFCSAGIPLKNEYVLFCNSPDKDRVGYNETTGLLRSHPEIDAIFAFNDSIAVNCYQAIVDLGLTPGKDIGLVGYDNTKICEIPSVHISSIQFKTYEIGKQAAEILLDMNSGKIDENSYPHIVFMPELVIRDTSVRLPGLRAESKPESSPVKEKPDSMRDDANYEKQE